MTEQKLNKANDLKELIDSKSYKIDGIDELLGYTNLKMGIFMEVDEENQLQFIDQELIQSILLKDREKIQKELIELNNEFNLL
jgi:hypothetical protein